VTFDGVETPGVSLLARSHCRLVFPFVITKSIKMVFAVVNVALSIGPFLIVSFNITNFVALLFYFDVLHCISFMFFLNNFT